MDDKNYQKGIFYGILAIFLVGLQPIVANSRPMIIDAYIFAAMSCSIQAILFYPLVLLERKKIRLNYRNNIFNFQEYDLLLNGWKKNKLLLFYVGVTFGIASILFFLGYQLAGAINGALTQKTTVIFALIFGYIINHEKITYRQIIFSVILMIGLFLAITQGSFNLLLFNMGVLMILITAVIWMLAHALTKPIFDRNEATPILIVFIRNTISGLILISTYFFFYPIKNLSLFSEPINIFYFIAMGVVYGIGLFTWYKVLQYLGTSKGAAMVSGTPLVTALFATILLGEIFTIFHIIGTFILMFSVLMIVYQKKKND
jgi:drug/metabolite transporter (DMT)-like permease